MMLSSGVRSASISSAICASAGAVLGALVAPRVRARQLEPGGRAGEVVLQVDAEELLVHRRANVPVIGRDVGSLDGRRCPSELEQALADAGGSGRAARLLGAPARPARRRARRGVARAGERRTGYETPIAVAVAASGGEVLAALPVSPELRADPGAVGERSARSAAAAVEQWWRAPRRARRARREDLRLRLGELDGMLLLAYPAAEPGRRRSTRTRRSTPSSRSSGSTACGRARTCSPATCWRGGRPARRRSAPRTRCAWPRP